MILQYFEVDEVTGQIIETHILDDEKDTIPPNYILGWGGDSGLHNPVYNWEIENWVESKSDEQFLLEAKEKKDRELNMACNVSILNGFPHTINDVVYWFSFDTEAQINFQGTERLLSKGIVQEIPWTARIGDKNGEYTRISINQQIMDELQLIILMHTSGNISKYRDVIMPDVANAQTVAEVDNIKWENY